MSTPLNGLREFPVDSQKIPTAPMSETRPMYWSVLREMWENRSIFLAPLIVAAVVLFASAISTVALPWRMRTAADPARRLAAVVKPYTVAPAPIMLTALIVGVFYCLDALYSERRDRSILFWKSLPISDGTTVLSKAAIPFVVLPLIAFGLSVITRVILLHLTTIILLVNRISPATLWAQVRFFEGLVVMLYGLTVHALWFAPIYGWLLLVSAWARRVPVLWALLPLLAISALEKITFNTWHFMKMLQYRVGGAMAEAFSVTVKGGGKVSMERVWDLQPGRFFGAPGLWVGVAFAAVCLTAAVRLRRNREPI